MYLEIEQYEKKIVKLVDFINNGPYKLEYILDKLDISRTTFYTKRKNYNFNLSEVKTLAKMYDDVDATTRLENQINEGLEDIKKGNVHNLDDVLMEVRAKYGL
jgi:hypothetical protein